MIRITSVFRWSHKWIALIVALFFIFKLATGIFLQLRKPVDWIQPPTQEGVGYEEYDPAVTHAQILAAAKSVPEANVDSWEDILLLDMRMKHGIVKVRTYDWYEVQIDTKTAKVLSHAQRWNDRIGAWHSGAGYGKFVLMIFSILAVLTFFLTASGVWLGVDSTIRKMKNRKVRKRAQKLITESGVQAPIPKRPFRLLRFCLDYHYYFAILVFLPYLVISFSGVMLQWRDLQGAYPSLEGGTLATVRGSSTVPTVTYKEAIQIALKHDKFEATKEKHIWRIYTYPNEGVIALRLKRHAGRRAQIDAATGEVLHIGEFTGDFWEDIHQGRFYVVTGDPSVKGIDLNLTLDVFLATHILATALWLLGAIALFKITFGRKKARQVLPDHLASDELPRAKSAGYQNNGS